MAEIRTLGVLTSGGDCAGLNGLIASGDRRIAEMEAGQLESLAGEPGNLNAAEFAALTRSDYERSGKLVRDAGIKGDQ